MLSYGKATDQQFSQFFYNAYLTTVVTATRYF